MLSPDEIAVMTRVFDRVRKGVPKGREFNDEEVVPFIVGAYKLMTECHALMDEIEAIGAESMSLGPARKNADAG